MIVINKTNVIRISHRNFSRIDDVAVNAIKYHFQKRFFEKFNITDCIELDFMVGNLESISLSEEIF